MLARRLQLRLVVALKHHDHAVVIATLLDHRLQLRALGVYGEQRLRSQMRKIIEENVVYWKELFLQAGVKAE